MTAESETWRPVRDYAGFYEVSNRYRVKSLDRNLPQRSRCGRPLTVRRRGHILRPWLSTSGRKQVALHDAQHRRRNRFVDDLVAETFGGAAAT
jgi:NUMOD4 motif